MIDIENLDKQDCFKVPDGYFESLPKEVMNKIHKEKAKKRNLWITSVAAVVLLLICTTLVTGYLRDTQSEQQLADKQKTEEIKLQEQMTDYYNSELAQIDYLNY